MSSPETGTNTKSNIDFIINDGEEDITGCVLIGGYFGLGRVGYMSIHHLIMNLEFRKIGYVVSDFLPPFVTVIDGEIQAPFEIYRYENIIILAAHFEPYKYEQRAFAEALVLWAKNKGISTLVQIGGLDNRYASEDDDCVIICSSMYDSESKGPKYPKMDDGLYVTGPAALAMLYAEFLKLPALLLLPYAERTRPDPKAAAIAIKTINETFSIDCPIDDLLDEASSIEIEEKNSKEIAEREALLANERRSSSGMFA